MLGLLSLLTGYKISLGRKNEIFLPDNLLFTKKIRKSHQQEPEHRNSRHTIVVQHHQVQSYRAYQIYQDTGDTGDEKNRRREIGRLTELLPYKIF